jgi:hypothetical protein
MGGGGVSVGNKRVGVSGVEVMSGAMGGVVGVVGGAVPAGVQLADRTRKKIWIECLSLNTGVPPDSITMPPNGLR